MSGDLGESARRVLRMIADHPEGVTRRFLREATGLSAPTVLAAVAKLNEDHLIEERRPGEGRRPGILTLAGPPGWVVGLDYGHNHIRAQVADPHFGFPQNGLKQTSFQVDADGQAALRRGVELVAEALEGAGVDPPGVRAIAVGIPAPLDHDGRLAPAAYLQSWSTIDSRGGIKARFQMMLSEQPNLKGLDADVVLENDANLGIRGELELGTAQGHDDVLFIKVSSGIGMGAYLSGSLLKGHSGAAGEVGHVGVSFEAEQMVRSSSDFNWLPQQECLRCRKMYCLENLASADAIVRQLHLTDAKYPADLSIRQVMEFAHEEEEHPLCREALRGAGTRLRFVIADLVQELDPSLVLIGGLLADAEEFVQAAKINGAAHSSAEHDDGLIKAIGRDRIHRTEVEGAVALAIEVARPAYAALTGSLSAAPPD